MSTERIEKMKVLVAAAPDDARARYFLAHELGRAGRHEEAAREWEAYLERTPGDEGPAYKSLGQSLEALGRTDEAAQAYRKGIEVARAHRHEALASEIEILLDAL